MKPSERPVAITKELSANDTGETGSHQAGLLVPKDPRILSFFPKVDASRLNPRHHLVFRDAQDGRWEFAFIYYNNALFDGTRNEYRLTRMTAFIRSHGLKAGDQVTLSRNVDAGTHHIEYRRAAPLVRSASGVLKLGSGWKEITI